MLWLGFLTDSTCKNSDTSCHLFILSIHKICLFTVIFLCFLVSLPSLAWMTTFWNQTASFQTWTQKSPEILYAGTQIHDKLVAFIHCQQQLRGSVVDKPLFYILLIFYLSLLYFLTPQVFFIPCYVFLLPLLPVIH